jgi:TRAP-type mannitol/chloroaromatic compound transport system permease large subunit
LGSAVDQASAGRKSLYKEVTGEFSMPSSFDAVSTSAGDMFMGAFVPGLVLVAAYMIFMLAVALIRPKLAPAVHFDGKYDAQFARRVLLILIPPLTLIFVVLGSIILGIATVNQAGAIGAVGATIMAGVRLYGDKPGAMRPALLAIASIAVLVTIVNVSPINVKNIQTTSDVVAVIVAAIATVAFLVSLAWAGWRTYKIDNTLTSVMVETAKTSSLVFIILLGAAMLTAAFRAFGGEELVREALTGLPGGFWSQFIIVMAVIFVLGFFLDYIEISVVVVPIVAPILLTDPSANVTAVWLGVMIGLNIQTSFLTPPFGFALFYLRGVAPAAVKTVQMYKGVIAFIILQLLALAIVAVNPSLVNYLPNRIWLTADTAPPPLNPRLQQCIEDYAFVQYREREDELRAAIELARRLDLSYVPKDLRKDTAASYDKAQRTFEMVAAVREAAAVVNAATPAYKPLHVEVRAIQRDVRRLDAEIKADRTQLERLMTGGPKVDQARMRKLEADIGKFQRERDVLVAQIPAQWKAKHKAFRQVQAAEDKARSNYRRNIDEAYIPVQELKNIVADTDKLAALESALVALRDSLPGADPAESVDKLADIAKAVGELAGTKAIRSDLTSARRALRLKQPDLAKALEEYDAAMKAYRDELVWRQRAKTELLPGFESYEASIRDTIGLRQQPRMPRQQAIELVGCTAKHRDISLHF